MLLPIVHCLLSSSAKYYNSRHRCQRRCRLDRDGRRPTPALWAAISTPTGMLPVHCFKEPAIAQQFVVHWRNISELHGKHSKSVNLRQGWPRERDVSSHPNFSFFLCYNLQYIYVLRSNSVQSHSCITLHYIRKLFLVA